MSAGFGQQLKNLQSAYVVWSCLWLATMPVMDGAIMQCVLGKRRARTSREADGSAHKFVPFAWKAHTGEGRAGAREEG